MAVVNLKVPTHTGSEIGSTVLADIKSDMQQIESSNNELESRQLIVDNAATQVITNVAIVAADKAVVAADKAVVATDKVVVATDRVAVEAAWNAALAANPDLNPAFRMNPATMLSDTVIPTGYNAQSVGPIEVVQGISITVEDNASWTII